MGINTAGYETGIRCTHIHTNWSLPDSEQYVAICNHHPVSVRLYICIVDTLQVYIWRGGGVASVSYIGRWCRHEGVWVCVYRSHNACHIHAFSLRASSLGLSTAPVNYLRVFLIYTIHDDNNNTYIYYIQCTYYSTRAVVIIILYICIILCVLNTHVLRCTRDG